MRRTLLCVLLVLPLWWSCSRPTSPEATEVSAADARRLLASTPWLDHMPAHEGDDLNLMQFDRQANGVYIKGNAYRGNYDVFRYEATAQELQLLFPADGSKAQTRYRIERLKRAGFDLRLTLTSSPRGPSAYYGFESRRELPAAVRARLPEARGR